MLFLFTSVFLALPTTFAGWSLPTIPLIQQDVWVEIQQGTLPLVISAPHGGIEKPKFMADRTEGNLIRDRGVREVAFALADELEWLTGHRPFVVTTRLHRVKLDANRAIEEAAQGNETAEKVWHQYHAALENCTTQAKVIGKGRALILDIHGHAHPEDWVELGYGVDANALAKNDQDLKDAAWIRGPKSLGSFFTAQGLRAVPSPAIRHPAGKKYFNGGYITRRHRGEGLRSIQLELPWSLRNAKASQASIAQLAGGISEFFAAHFSIPVPNLNPKNFPAEGPLAVFGHDFDRYSSAFGIPILATKNLAKEKLRHAVHMLAEYLDNDENGVVDDVGVLKALRHGGAFLVMPARERDMRKLSRGFGRWERAGWNIGQDLYGEETNSTGRFDAALEEIWHLVSNGWGEAYPDVFSFEKGSQLCDAMDRARKPGGHYHYGDPTCNYHCQAAEYSYWVLTTLLGAQKNSNRAEEIFEEWECATAEELKKRDPAAVHLFTHPKFSLPHQLPNGSYREN